MSKIKKKKLFTQWAMKKSHFCHKKMRAIFALSLPVLKFLSLLDSVDSLQ